MKHLSPLLLLLPLAVNAQTGWNVDVGGSLIGSPQPYYNPQMLTIQVGDTVHWHASSGTHNVYGQQDIFPDNPVGFGSGSPAASPWDFSFVFTVPGIYDYHCTKEDHSATQFGTITVLNTNGVLPVAPVTAVSIHPNPAADQLVLDLKGCTGALSAQIVGADGQVKRTVAVSDGKANTIDLAGLSAGQYYLVVDRTTRKKVLRFVKL